MKVPAPASGTEIISMRRNPTNPPSAPLRMNQRDRTLMDDTSVPCSAQTCWPVPPTPYGPPFHPHTRGADGKEIAAHSSILNDLQNALPSL